MKCSRCGYDNPEGVAFCENCSARLSERPDSGSHPSWNIVKGPRWADPDFSADSVSENDIPSDFESEYNYSSGRYDNRRPSQPAAERPRPSFESAPRQSAPDNRYSDDEGETTYAANRPRDEYSIAEEQFRNEQRYLRERAEEEDYEDEDDVDVYDEETSSRRNQNGALQFFSGLFKHKQNPRPNSTRYNDDYDDGYGSRRSSGRSGGMSKRTKLLIKRIGFLVVALGLVALLIWGIVKLFSPNGCIGKGCSKTQTSRTPIVEPVGDDDSTYFVTVYAKEGQVLVYKTSDGSPKEVTVPSSGFVKFRVPVASLIPNEPIEGSTVTVVPQVFIKNSDGTETQVTDIEPIIIQVPALKIEYSTPDIIVSEDGTIEIKGHAELINTELTIDGESVYIEGDGTFTYTKVFEDTGDFTIEAVAKYPGHQINHHSFNVTVNKATPAEALVELPWEYGDNEFSQRIKNSSDTITVKGRVPAGSVVTASCDSSNATLTTPVVASDGSFSFNVTMRVAGDYVLHITCTTEDGLESTREMHVQRQPDMVSYKSGARDMNYEAIKQGNSLSYKLSGTITEILKNDDYILAVLEIAEGKTVILEYHHHYGSAATIEVGKTFNNNIYCRSDGLNDEGIPHVYVWFID